LKVHPCQLIFIQNFPHLNLHLVWKYYMCVFFLSNWTIKLMKSIYRLKLDLKENKLISNLFGFFIIISLMPSWMVCIYYENLKMSIPKMNESKVIQQHGFLVPISNSPKSIPHLLSCYEKFFSTRYWKQCFFFIKLDLFITYVNVI
jgi:hypothetical protein